MNNNMMTDDFALKIISEQIVEAASQEIGGLSDEQARRHMNQVSRAQPALLAFVSAFSEDLDQEAAELAIYLFVVTVRTFEMEFGKRLQNVGPKRIESIHDANLKVLDGLLHADDSELERAAIAQSAKQPWVWKYVAKSLFESDDEDMNLSREDQASLSMIMKTVIDALESSVR